MKAKELKQLLDQIDDETEIGIHIPNGKSDATEIFCIANDTPNNKKEIWFVHKDDVLK